MAIPDELTRRVNQKGPEIPTAKSVIVAYRFGRSTVRANASSAPLSSSPPQAYRGGCPGSTRISRRGHGCLEL